MFHLDEQNVYRAESLLKFDWLDHGFGTKLTEGWPDLERLVTPKQVHSDRVILVPPDAPTGATARLGQGDALVSDQRHLMVGIRTADCLPILLVDAKARKVGAIHAGWRGTVAGISPKAVQAMVESGSRPEDIWAAIGPGIGACCFKVGPEVAVQFETDSSYIDLADVNRRQLEAAGIPPGQIESSELCTMCGAEHFHSYRRDKEKAGRMISAIGFRS